MAGDNKQERKSKKWWDWVINSAAEELRKRGLLKGEIRKTMVNEFGLSERTIRSHLDEEFKEGQLSKKTSEVVAEVENIAEIPDPYASIRKFTKFKDPEELVTRIVALRDEGFNYRELWGDPMAAKIPSYTYVTMMITRGKPLEKVLQAMRERPLHKPPDSQGPRASEYRRVSHTKQETSLLTELNKRGIPPEQLDLSIVEIHHDSCSSS